MTFNDLYFSRLEKRYEEGKIASMKINVYHDDSTNELVITVVEVTNKSH